MSLSSNLELRKCPRCGREILGSSDRCQFCGVEVVPTVELKKERPVKPLPMARSSQPGAWVEAANAIIGILWMISGAFSALGSLMLGPLGLVGFFAGGIIFLIGLGIFRQQWLAMSVAKLFCFAVAIYCGYMLIAVAASPELRAIRSPIYLLIVLAISIFQGYVLSVVGD